MKVRCILIDKRLNGILDKNDVVELETLKYEKDEIIVRRIKTPQHWPDGWGMESDEVIAKKGTLKGWQFKSKDGDYYTDRMIYNTIGNKALDDIFVKLDN